jgi:hypothetical protein
MHWPLYSGLPSDDVRIYFSFGVCTSELRQNSSWSTTFLGSRKVPGIQTLQLFKHSLAHQFSMAIIFFLFICNLFVKLPVINSCAH